MLKRFAVVCIVLCACSVASAGGFTVYGNRSAIYGNTWNGGGMAWNPGYGATYWQGNIQPSIPLYPVYAPVYYYRPAPVMNDYYRSSPYQGYGFKGW
jgi:hypothetical protein